MSVEEFRVDAALDAIGSHDGFARNMVVNILEAAAAAVQRPPLRYQRHDIYMVKNERKGERRLAPESYRIDGHREGGDRRKSQGRAS